MNFEKFTEKSMNAVSEAQNQASVRNSQSIEVCHFLLALLSDSSGLIPELMKSIGVDAAGIRAEVERVADSLPRISGSGYSKDRIYLDDLMEQERKIKSQQKADAKAERNEKISSWLDSRISKLKVDRKKKEQTEEVQALDSPYVMKTENSEDETV